MVFLPISCFLVIVMVINPSAAVQESVSVSGDGTLNHKSKTTAPQCSAGVCSVGQWAAYRSGMTMATCQQLCESGRITQALSNGPTEKIYALRPHARFHDVIGGPVQPRLDRNVSSIKYRGTGHYWPGWNVRDHFYAVWEGTITITTAGKYYFWTSSDDGSQMFIGGQRVVYNPGWHGMRLREGSITLAAGDHSFKAEMFEGGGGAGMECYWGGSPSSRSRKDMKTGSPFKSTVNEKGYSFQQNGRFHTMPITMPPKTPRKVKNVDQINYPIVAPNHASWGFPGFRDWFYVRWEGYINITVAGTYKFSLTSNDGSRLFIDGREVTSRAGWQPGRPFDASMTHSADVQLAVGMQPFWVEMYQGNQAAGIQFQYQPPGGALVTVPKSVLFAVQNPVPTYELANAPWNRKGACDAFSYSGNECILYHKCDTIGTTDYVCGDDLGDVTNFQTCKYHPFSMTGIILTNSPR